MEAARATLLLALRGAATCGSGECGMEKAQMGEFEALFGHKRAALALLCLHEHGPKRWTDIRDAMSQRSGAVVGDKAATRALQALQRLGLVVIVNGDDGSSLYALTPLGTDRSRQVEELFARLDEHGAGPGPS